MKRNHWWRWLTLSGLCSVLLCLNTAWGSGWYNNGQLIQYGAPMVMSYPTASYYPAPAYTVPPQYYAAPGGQPAAAPMMQAPPVMMALPDSQYYYALPNGTVLNPAPAMVVPYPVYYTDPGYDDTASPMPSAQTGSQVPGKGRFSVLAGSFLEENLAQLSERYIQALGYSAYRQHIKVKGKQFTRIFAGPFMEKKQAAEASKQMQARYNMPSVVVPYRP